MRSVYTILVVVMLMVFTMPSIAQIDWEKYEGNPVLLSDSAGVWDEDIIAFPSVLFNGTMYHMWYSSYNDNPSSIGYATSADGITWTKYDDPATTDPPYDESDPVLYPGSPGTYDDEHVSSPTVILVDDLYHMWYAGDGESSDPGNSKICHATSSDGIMWTKDTLNPVVNRGVNGTWDDYWLFEPCVVYDGDIYHMWYCAWNGNYPPDRVRIGHATAPHPDSSWTKDPNNPILDIGAFNSWDYDRVDAPSVVFDGSKFHMFYSGGSYLKWQVGYATSADGSQWEKLKNNPVLSYGNSEEFDAINVSHCSVIMDTLNNQFKMWYIGARSDFNGHIGYATASIILNVPDRYLTIRAAIDAAVDGDVVLVDEGTYYENINFKGKAITVASQFYMDGDTSHISNTVIDGSQPANPDSGSVVFLISGEDTTSVLMGFTITNGSGTKGQYTYDGVKYDTRDGGGILCYNSGGRFVSNKIVNNTISSETEAFGGGVAAGDFGSTAWVILEQNHIINNTVNGLNGGFGGGVGLSCHGKLIDNIISYNSCYAAEDESAGGGVYTGTEPSEPRTVFIEENDINHNLVQGNGTQPTYYWSARGGGIFNDHCKILVLENEISNNELIDLGTGNGSGGGIYTYLAEEGSLISHNTISNNLNGVTDTKYGGGISLASNDVPVYNNIITGNSASHGGGIRLNHNNAKIINNTIVNNTASVGAGGLAAPTGLPIVMNSIVWGNHAGNGVQIGGNFYVRYSDVEGGYTGEGNIDMDPFFADGNFNLSDTSYCVGNGKDSVNVNRVWYISPETDYNGNVRPHSVDEFVDMGAIESPYERVIIDDISGLDLLIPHKFELLQNYPNPFNPVTAIGYQLSAISDVELSIYNLLGQNVVTLVSEKQKEGHHQVEWDASGFASGVYYYRIEAGEFQDVKKMILLR